MWLTGTRMFAQQYNFKTWSLEEGLPQSEVTCLTQDPNGYLWLGTMGGLSRFDGVHFRNFTTENGLSSNNIRCIFLDQKNTFWIGTFNQGMCSFDGEKFRTYSERDGIPAGGVFSITQTSDGTLWLSTSQGLAFRKNGKFELVKNQPALPSRPFWVIKADKRDNIWLGTLDKGLYRYNPNNVLHFTTKDGLASNAVFSILERKDGSIWVGNTNGISQYVNGRFKRLTLPLERENIRCISLAEGRGGLYIGSEGDGLLRFNGKNFTHYSDVNGLASNHILSLLSDREGNLWLGTVGGGLQRFTPNAFVHFPKNGHLRNSNVTALTLAKDGNLWLGTLDGGIAKYDNKTFEWFTQKQGLPSNNISDLKTDQEGNIWLATDKGLSRYDGHGFRNFNQKNGLAFDQINYCLPDTRNRLWIATSDGLSVFDGSQFRNYKNNAKKDANVILCIFKDRQQRIWLGTRAGIFEFRRGRFISYPEMGKFGLCEITTIAQDQQDNLWFGSLDYGLLHFYPNKVDTKPELFSHKRGLISDGIKALTVDSANNLWIGTNRGVAKLNLENFYKTHRFEPQTFTFASGFKGIEVNPNAIVQGQNNHVWFGTIKGLTRYNPRLEIPDTCKPIIHITGLRLFLQKTNWTKLEKNPNGSNGLPKNLKLHNDQNHVTFDFQGIYLTNPTGLRYSYMLEGFDKKWSQPTRQPIATYSNLEAGNYTFLVKACTNKGNCSSRPAQYKFAIVPPFWTTERIVGTWVVLGALIAFAFVRWREQNLKRLNMLLEENVEQRTQMLAKENQEKEILLKEVHHRVKNNLQIITSLLNLQSRHVQDPAALDTLREIKDRIKSISMLHQRLYQREELAAIELSEYVKTLCRSLFASYGVREDHVRLQFDIPKLYLDIDTALTLGLIVNELVSNTLKYAFPEQRKGTLLIELLRITETNYTLTISDDGTGLPENFEEKMGASFGLQLVASLVKKLHGTLKFYSQNGTQIRLQFVILPQ